jgi:hypothetical protein
MIIPGPARLTALLLLTLLWLPSCKTTQFSSERIHVPPGLRLDQVEVALVAALANYQIVPGLDPRMLTAENAMNSLYGFTGSASKQNRWVPESRAQSTMVAGYRWRSHYLQIVMKYDQANVQLYIGDSRNLRQSGDTIHKGAIVRIRDLGRRIERSLGQMVAYRGTGPTVASEDGATQPDGAIEPLPPVGQGR